jgi:transaldolase
MAALTPLQSLVACGTKLWLDSVDPQAVKANRAYGATGATSNPIIIADLIKTGRFDDLLTQLIRDGLDDSALAWRLTDHLVKEAQAVFLPVWQETRGDNGYVSFELDPLLEDASCKLSVPERTARYVELGQEWSKGHKNRMIKVPATPAGLAALEDLAAAGVTLNVTLVFGADQYTTARDAIWRGAQRRPGGLGGFKSVYSIFVSRLDVYTAEKVPQLSPAAQGQVGILNAKRIWRMNRDFWKDKGLPLHQEMIFASTGTKKPEDPPWKYVEAFAGSDIETNPPATNDAVQKSGRTITSHINEMPPPEVVKEIDTKVDMHLLEKTLMEEGLKKFADPQKALLRLIAEKRASLRTAVPG